MVYKTISLSLLLTIALGMSACGGGGKKADDLNTTGSDPVADTNPPVFAADSVTNRSIEENGAKEIATYTISDESIVNFELQGSDADDFSLGVNIVDSKYKITLKLKDKPDFEKKESYNVTLVATDEHGNSASKDITVNVTDQPFAFNVTGNMSPTVAGGTNTLELATEEAKSDVTYQVIGANFTLNGNTVTFTAPAYVDGGNNTYIALVTANDGNSDIGLTIKASVIKDANATPDVKTYLLKSRKDININSEALPYEQYQYTYDTDGYLVEMIETGTNISTPQRTRFEYSDDHKIMKGYRMPDNKLKSIRVFADKKTNKSKVVADIDLRLSSDQYTHYMTYVQDTAALKKNRHLVKYIHGLEFSQKKVELYVYNDSDQLSRILTGSYEVGFDALVATTDAQLESPNAPSGGFPSGDIKLSTDQLNSLNSGTLPVSISHETTYIYDNGKLSERKYFGYKVDKTQSDTVNVTYFNDGAIKEIKSADHTIKYDTDSLLKDIDDDYKYSYTQSGNELTVTVKNGIKTVTTYIFEEE